MVSLNCAVCGSKKRNLLKSKKLKDINLLPAEFAK